MLVRVLLGVLSAAILFVPRLGAAQPVFDAHRCDNCSGMQQMSGVAVQHGVGIRYVFSVPNGEIRKFQVERYCGSNPQAGGGSPRTGDRGFDDAVNCTWWQYVALEEPVEPDVAAFISDLRDAYIYYGNSLEGRETFHYSQLRPHLSGQHEVFGRGVESNAYSFVRNSRVREEILDTYNQMLSEQRNPHTLLQAMAPQIEFGNSTVRIRFGLAPDAKLRTYFVFDDGSTVFIDVEGGFATYRLGTARDANGVPVPDHSYDPVTGGSPGGGMLGGGHTPTDPQQWCQMVSQLAGIPCEQGQGGPNISCGRVNGGGLQCIRI